MGTTLLERTDPVRELHSALRGRRPGIGRDILAELDELERNTDPAWRPVTGRRTAAATALRALKPRLDFRRPKAAREPNPAPAPEPPVRAEPRRWTFPSSWNLPPKPDIRVVLHNVAHWGATQLPPVLMPWKPMLRPTPNNSRVDDMWRSFFGHWDVFNDLCARRAKARARLMSLSLRVGMDDAVRDLRGWSEEGARGVWGDFLGLFSPVEGTVAARIAGGLKRLDDLALL